MLKRQMSLAEKRSKHQRSLTLSSLPSNIIPDVKPSSCSRSSLEHSSRGKTSPERSGSGARKVLSLNSEEGRQEQQEIRGVTRCRSTNRPRTKVSRKISGNDFNQSHSLLTCTKSNSGSTNIFSKVKDKIVETVYQTQDMPHWAAIVQEKRQKAADQCEAKIAYTLNKDFLNMTAAASTSEDVEECTSNVIMEEEHAKTTKEKVPIGNREKARQGFRRRSISQDSYPQNLLPKACPLVMKKSSDGITCSSVDFQAILLGFNNYMKHAKGTSSASSASSMLSRHGETSSRQLRDPDVESIQATSKSIQEVPCLRLPTEGNLSKIIEDDASPKPTTTDVEYDENGQTWGVYGAEIDPKILGDAIQIHLQKIISQNVEKSESSHKANNRQEKRGLRKLKPSKHSCFVSRFFCFFEKKSNQL